MADFASLERGRARPILRLKPNESECICCATSARFANSFCQCGYQRASLKSLFGAFFHASVVINVDWRLLRDLYTAQDHDKAVQYKFGLVSIIYRSPIGVEQRGSFEQYQYLPGLRRAENLKNQYEWNV